MMTVYGGIDLHANNSVLALIDYIHSDICALEKGVKHPIKGRVRTADRLSDPTAVAGGAHRACRIA
jgi:hypothetical protein